MSDAGGEYKAFDLMLKEQGIHILQSAPHTPQQNGHAEQFMRTVMDKSEAVTVPPTGTTHLTDLVNFSLFLSHLI